MNGARDSLLRALQTHAEAFGANLEMFINLSTAPEHALILGNETLYPDAVLRRANDPEAVGVVLVLENHDLESSFAVRSRRFTRAGLKLHLLTPPATLPRALERCQRNGLRCTLGTYALELTAGGERWVLEPALLQL